ncbi:hypothetical protein N9Y90_00800 [Flavobacteriales bacterium]|nr:hypothetical protein [Flavobacteriales bacterium]
MAKKKANKTEEQFAAVEETLTRTEQWVENNQKQLSTFVFGVVAVIALYLAYDKFYVQTVNQEAQEELFVAVEYFEKDSFNLALNGVNDNLGLLDIIDDYGSTEAGNLAYYYAGISYLNLGDNESAIDFLSDFSSDDDIVSSICYGSLGDAYMNIDEKGDAINYWTKAAFNSENKFTSPIYLKRAAMALEEDENFDKAVEYYTIIKTKYSTSDEARDIEKYITRAELRK